MIIRHMLRRQGQRLPATPLKSCTRSFADRVDVIESSLQDSLPETQSTESMMQHQTSQFTPRVDDQSLDYHNDESVRRYKILQHQKETTGHFGSSIAPHYKPSELLRDPLSPSSITLELLLASQSHLGHSTSLWNPMNSRYIYGIRQGIHIISLDVTASHLRRACKVVSGVTERGGLILFVGTRPGQALCTINAAKLAGGCHLFERWIPGSITNNQQILGRCKLKVVDEFDREVKGYQEELLDHPAMKPDLVVCLNPLENYVILHECALNDIPTIGVIDTDANPNWVTYPIPANDDSLRCIHVIAGVLGKAGEEGHTIRRRKALNGEITYTPNEIIPIAGKDDDNFRFRRTETT